MFEDIIENLVEETGLSEVNLLKHHQSYLQAAEELIELCRKHNKPQLEYKCLIRKVRLFQDLTEIQKTLQDANLLFNDLCESIDDPITKLKLLRDLLLARADFEYKKHKNINLFLHDHRKANRISGEIRHPGHVNILVFDLLDNAPFKFQLADLKTFSELIRDCSPSYMRGQDFSYLEDLDSVLSYLKGSNNSNQTITNLWELFYNSKIDEEVWTSQVHYALDLYITKMTLRNQKIPSGTPVLIGLLGNWRGCDEDTLALLTDAGLQEIGDTTGLLGNWRGCEEDALALLTYAGLQEIGDTIYDGHGMLIVTSTTPIPETLSSMRHVIIEEEAKSSIDVEANPVQYSEIKKQIFKRQQQREKIKLFSMVDEMIAWLKKRKSQLTNANVKRFIAEKGLHNVSVTDRREFDQKVWEKLSTNRR